MNPTAEQINLWNSQQNQKRAPEIQRLVPITVELAKKAARSGITVADIRLAAVQRGILTGAEKGRELSYLNAVPRAAGLHNTRQYRRSVIDKAHGNLNVVWLLPEYAEAAA